MGFPSPGRTGISVQDWRTHFATHYHQLIGLEGGERLCNVHVQVLKWTVNSIPSHRRRRSMRRFLRCSGRSFGGLPRNVVERASDLLAFLSSKQVEQRRANKAHLNPEMQVKPA